MDLASQDEITSAEQQHCDDAGEQQPGETPDDNSPGDGRAHPFFIDRPIFSGGDVVEALLHQRQQLSGALVDGAVEGAGIEDEGVAELIFDTKFVEVIYCRRLIDREDAQILIFGRLHDSLIIGIFLDAVDAVGGKGLDNGISLFDADGETSQ